MKISLSSIVKIIFVMTMFTGISGRVLAAEMLNNSNSKTDTDMRLLIDLENKNPELKSQVAGGCGQYWDDNKKMYVTKCTDANFRSGVIGALGGGFLGLMGGTEGALIGATLGYLLFYNMNSSITGQSDY